MSESRCAKHPKYEGKRKPTSDCAACQKIFDKKERVRKSGGTIKHTG